MPRAELIWEVEVAVKPLALMVSVLVVAGCRLNEDGERCNPLRATSDCVDGLICVYPTGPSCGVSYCCQVDSNGNIVDPLPNCQPDPDAIAACIWTSVHPWR